MIIDQIAYPAIELSHVSPEFTESEVQQIIQQIADGRLKPSLKTSFEHAKHVREIVAAKHETAESPPIKSCPKCGSEMKLRTAKKGQELYSCIYSYCSDSCIANC